MSVALEFQMAPRLGLEVSPALVMFGEMLVLPYAAMSAVLEDELADNPMLERLEPDPCPLCRGSGRQPCPACSARSRVGPNGASPQAAAADVPDQGTDSLELLRAVRLEVAGADLGVAEYVIDSLDEHGCLDRSAAEVARELGVDEGAVARVIEVVRRTGPPGVGATSVSECLLLQLDALDLEGPAAELARVILADHLEALGRGHLAAIASALGLRRGDVEEALELIRTRLRPHPAFDGNVSARPRYVVPEVVVCSPNEPGGDFGVELVEPAVHRLQVRPRPASDGLVEPDDAQDGLRRAHALVSQLHDRWATLQRVASYAIQRQQDFLLDGPAALRPLTRAEAAVDLGMHESTVSRAVADKFVLLPDRSVVPLSRFFGTAGALETELRRLLSCTTTQLSDQRLADLLRESGFPVARRTVAKHRARLGIPSTLLR